jgi:hypothetical protein
MEETKPMIQAFKEVNEELKYRLAIASKKAADWESVARRMYYVANTSGFDEFYSEWFSNEIKELQGTLSKEDNPNHKK